MMIKSLLVPICLSMSKSEGEYSSAHVVFWTTFWFAELETIILSCKLSVTIFLGVSVKKMRQ